MNFVEKTQTAQGNRPCVANIETNLYLTLKVKNCHTLRRPKAFNRTLRIRAEGTNCDEKSFDKHQTSLFYPFSCFLGKKLNMELLHGTKFDGTLNFKFQQKFSSYMGVSKNKGTPKWMVYNGKHH